MPRSSTVRKCPERGAILYLVMTSNRVPLRGVTVGIVAGPTEPASSQAVTDNDGFAEFHDLEPGRYEMIVTVAAGSQDILVRRDRYLDVVGGDEAFGTANVEVAPVAPVVFGLQARTADEIGAALTLGYRAFDGGDTYRISDDDKADTTASLAQALAESGVERKAIRVIYKIDAVEPESLSKHVRAVAGLFDGRIDDLLVHHAQGDDTGRYLKVMRGLRKAGVVTNIGIGDPARSSMNAYPADCYEVAASTLFETGGGPELARLLANTGKPVYVYDIIGTLGRLKQLSGNAAPLDDSDSRAFLSIVRSAIPTAVPILSTSSEQRMKNNFDAALAEDLDAVDFANRKALQNGIEAARAAAVVPIAGMSASIRTRLGQIVGGTNWAAAAILPAVQETVLRRIEAARFTAEERNTIYVKGEVWYKLETVLEDLQAWDKNCSRVKAATFISDAIALHIN